MVMKRRESSGSPSISHQPAQITSYYENMQRMLQHKVNEHRANFLPYNFSHEHAHRSGSPHDPRDLREYHHLMKGMERPPSDHRPLVSPHPAHPFTPRGSEAVSLDFHRLPPQSGRPHLPGPQTPTSIEAAYAARGHQLSDSAVNERIPSIDRPPVSSSLLQPQLHAHHHTHTHLHLHDEIKYRNQAAAAAAAANDPAHFDRHDRAQHPNIPPTPPIPTHRPSSRSSSREMFEFQHKPYTSEALAQARLRDMNRHHTPLGRESHAPPPVVREGAASPSFPHDSGDPVAYHHFITQFQQRKSYPLAGRHGHGQAPDLSPRGLPQGVRHNMEFNREAVMEKHMSEKNPSSNPLHLEREKLMREQREQREQQRAYDEKQRHHRMFQERAAGGSLDQLKMKSDMSVQERLYREEHQRMFQERAAGGSLDQLKVKSDIGFQERQYREEMHPQYHSYEMLRRIHEPRQVYDRTLHDQLYGHERERERIDRERMERETRIAHMERERLLSDRAAIHHERFMRHERLPHTRSPMEQHPLDRASAHERESIYRHLRTPETVIDLSGD